MIFRSVGNGDICDKEGGGIFSHVDHRQTTGAKVVVCVVSTEPTNDYNVVEQKVARRKWAMAALVEQGVARNNIYDNGLFLLTLKWVSAR